MVSVCLPSDALSQGLSSYLGFPYLGRGVSLHSCFSNVQNLFSRGDGFLVELFQILKDEDVKVLHSICQKIRKKQWPQDWKKVNFHSNPKERQDQRMLKLLHNCIQLTH